MPFMRQLLRDARSRMSEHAALMLVIGSQRDDLEAAFLAPCGEAGD